MPRAADDAPLRISLPAKLLAHVRAHPGITTRQLAEAFAVPSSTLRAALVRQRDRGLLRNPERPDQAPAAGTFAALRWLVVNDPAVTDRPRYAESCLEERHWVPRPYVNPIRARALGLPVRTSSSPRSDRVA